MTMQEVMTEAAKLRLRLHLNSRLRLELLAALSRVFRENNEPLRDEVLASIVLAVPQELVGEAELQPNLPIHARQPVGVGVPKTPPPLGVPKTPPPLSVPKTPPPLGVPKTPPPGKPHFGSHARVRPARVVRRSGKRRIA